ncbi:carbonic anhydrase [Geobacter pickeringii]|uniref:carbonic anhydrase n=1 Tax=Geobacter pickeringii TaxID=345632 RepID=A0A0B5BB18_9BACT|nr:carbonic anhydrase [Geobacter pickeringii]AJE03752.1 carbonic anhydrase [Geobacter pickeringii]
MKSRRSSIVRFVIGTAVTVSAAVAFASGGGVGVTADEALQRLMDGNKHYVEGQLGACRESDAAKRESLATGQKPYAIILSCSDSRVPPEIVFDKSMGEIFVVRVAGNVPDPVVLGSIEYAAEHIGSPLIMVLGHERCGAVTAAVDAKGKPEGNIGAIVKTIAPAVRKAKAEAKGKSKAELVEAACEANVKLVARSLTKRSPVIAKLAKEGKIKIVTAKYDLDDGKVSLLDEKK